MRHRAATRRAAQQPPGAARRRVARAVAHEARTRISYSVISGPTEERVSLERGPIRAANGTASTERGRKSRDNRTRATEARRVRAVGLDSGELRAAAVHLYREASSTARSLRAEALPVRAGQRAGPRVPGKLSRPLAARSGRDPVITQLNKVERRERQQPSGSLTSQLARAETVASARPRRAGARSQAARGPGAIAWRREESRRPYALGLPLVVQSDTAPLTPTRLLMAKAVASDSGAGAIARRPDGGERSRRRRFPLRA